jgi:2-polyprenyl-3-methyl-5-hydroxy-6-metoxy-1,4-benzoquinol methylase
VDQNYSKDQKDPLLEVAGENPWYTASQLKAAEGHQSRTIQRRHSFILRCIEAQRKKHPRKGPDAFRILDAGCGDGVNLKLLCGIPGLKVWGLDYNSLRLMRASAAFPGVRVVRGSVLEMPFRPESFDAVLCSQVIEHVPEDTAVLRDMARMLRPGGLLVLGTPNEGCLMARLRNHVLERSILRTTDHVHFYTANVIGRKLREAGFEIREVIRENWFFPRQHINSFLSGREWGFRLMAWLGRNLPSQTCGYYFQCVKS